MLKHLRIHNFKTFQNFEIDLTRRHLLIGKNNSGKSNLCSALRFLAITTQADYSEIPGELDQICHWWSKSKQVEFECLCELPYGDSVITYSYTLWLDVGQKNILSIEKEPASTVLERLQIRDERHQELLLFESDGLSVQLLDEPEYDLSREVKYNNLRAPLNSTHLSKIYETRESLSRVMNFKRFLRSMTYTSLSPPLMRAGWAHEKLSGNPDNIILYMHGENLPFVLYVLKNRFEPCYRRIMDIVSRIEPNIDSLSFYTAPENRPVPSVILRDGREVPWSTLSDGTLWVLALATQFYIQGTVDKMPDAFPRFCIIEEPDNYLSRSDMKMIWEDFSSASIMSQWLFTSHSPYFIDLFDRELDSISLLTRKGNITTVESLADHREPILKESENYSLGEQYFLGMF